MKPITEETVMDYYLELMKEDKIEFLVNKPKKKKAIRDIIKKFKKTEDIHDKILLAKDLWIIFFESAMVFIDPDKQGYDSLFIYFNEFVEFEELIFASDKFYRDHTLHSLWVYFLGEYLYNNPEFSPLFVNFNYQQHRSANTAKFFEKLGFPHIFGEFCEFLKKVYQILPNDDSIRCVIALAHDLGYPLKKIAKINKSIGRVLPYFSISKYGEFNFQYENVQQFYIENLLELMSCDMKFSIEIGDIPFDEQQMIKEHTALQYQIHTALNKIEQPPDNVTEEFRKYLENISEKEIHIWRRIYAGAMRLDKSMSRLMRFANDFEQYQHGIMSSYLLMKLLNAFSNIQISYSDPSSLSIDEMDIPKIFSKLRILGAMADHTSPGFKMSEIDSYSALLMLIDEIEEFSRISRANQYRQFLNEFCKTEISYDEGCLCIDFIFDDVTVVGLNPEIAFKDKAKKFLSIFNIPELNENLRIRFRSIGRLPHDNNTYELNISREFFSIKINDEEVDPQNYLKTKEVFES
ncbi:MAG: hypothetical protein FK731_15195 [Asgard group archaeon]|nr:hypothetical protein [Asgard group archaeon]